MVIVLFLSFLIDGACAFYPQDYEESRKRFQQSSRQAASRLGEVRYYSLRVPSPTQPDLTMEVLAIPQRRGQPTNLVIVTSGIHGAEAFAGAAIQIDFIDNHLDLEDLNHSGFLFIHAVNPFGFKNLRRVSENNVDLNRNMAAGPAQSESFSEDYQRFEDFLNPKSQLSANYLDDAILFFKALSKLFQYGRKKLAQIALGGQYQNPKGIYFGGKEPEPQVNLLRQEFARMGRPYQRIIHIDLHTGFGEKGKLHFFSDRSLANGDGFKKLFEGYSIDYGQDEDFYRTTGSFGEFTLSLFKDKEVIPMTFEFGTMDSQTIWGGFASLRALIYENQGQHHGFANSYAKKRTSKLFLELFNPSDPDWRRSTVEQGVATLNQLVTRMASL